MTILTVGSGQQYATLSAAIAVSQDGDTLYVKAGTYLNDFATINTKLSIVGVGGMVQLVATEAPPNGKAILVTGTDVSLDHIEFSGAAVPDGNGAGIRYEGGNLSITNSYFHNNQDGILAASVPGGTISIDHSEYANNGAGTGQTHNIYINEIATLRVTNSYLHDAIAGHELKSRADNTIILNNRIFDNQSDASYSIDVPNGGATTVQGNVIQQGPNSQNGGIISYAAETTTPYANSQLIVSQNTILNERSGFALAVANNSAITTAQITGNHFFGLTGAQIGTGSNVQSGNDFLATEPTLDISHAWLASPWDNLVSGGVGADGLKGTLARDLFVGGDGNDTFLVKAGGGSDTIADFAAGVGASDVVSLDSYMFVDFAAVRAAMGQNGSDTLLNLGNGETLTFKDLQVSSFAADDFTFANSTPIAPVVQPFVLPESGAPTKFFSGNVRSNPISGSSGNDYIDGRGGNDTMRGGAGDDTYVVDSSKDSAVEKTGQGIDTVISTATSYKLGANLENLTLAGNLNHIGVGNDLNNLMEASTAGNDRLDGGAGNDILKASTGADILTGGLGNDMFVFSAIGGQSRITDFHIGEDLLDVRPLLAAAGYNGANPIADGVIAITPDGSGGLILSADPYHNGAMHPIVDLLGIEPLALRIGTDLLWHS